MKTQKQQQYRQRLHELAEQIQRGMPSLRATALRGTGGEASGNLSNAPIHLADLGTDNFQQEIDAGLLQNEQQILGAIGAALDRLDAGSYGACARCGKKIPEARLQAVPYASRCLPCEKRAEREMGTERGPILE